MAETQRSVEERLAMLEGAVAGLATVFEVRHRELATQLTKSMQDMTNIIKQQKHKECESSHNRYGYVNWETSHKELETHSYICLKDFDATFRKYCEIDEEEYNDDNDFSEPILDVLNNAFKVDKTNRFPSEGKYVNIKMPKLQDHIDNILFAIEHGGDYSLGRWASHVYDLVEKVDDMIKNKRDGVYDLKSFEKKYKLTWKDLN